MTDNEYRKTRKAAVDALIYWAKTGMIQFSMRDAVNNHLETSGANRPSIGGTEAILARRKIAANRLAIDCLYALSGENGAFPPTRDGCIHSLSMRERG